MAAGATYEPITTQTLSSTTASITFSSIPSTYTDLIVASLDISTGAIQGISVRVGNGTIDTGSNYSRTTLDGYNSPSSSTDTNVTNLDIGVISPTAVGSSIYHFMNYANTSTYKTILSKSGNPQYMRTAVGLWRSTAAINQIQIYPSSYSWSAGSTFTLYGIKAA